MSLKFLGLALLVGFNMITGVQNTNTNGEKEVTISFVGDCTLGTYKGQSGNTLFTNYFDNYGKDYFSENVKPIFENDDITFINLEGPLTKYDQTAVKEFPIKGQPNYVDILSCSSIEVCNLANNHIYDCGQVGFEDNVNNLTNANIGYCGEGYVYRTEKNGIKVSCLGYRAFNVTEELKETICNDIVKEKNDGVNVVCVMFHWGNEREYYSNSTQENLAHYTIDCGADIVVGGHPHVMQGIEQYNGRTIVYSLGNFSFGANKNPKDKDTFIFQQSFKLNDDNTVVYSNSSIIPCSISSQDTLNDYKPTPLDETKKQRVLDRLVLYSTIYDQSYFLDNTVGG